MITTSPPQAACQVTIQFTAVNEIDISAAQSAATPYFDIYVSHLPHCQQTVSRMDMDPTTSLSPYQACGWP